MMSKQGRWHYHFQSLNLKINVLEVCRKVNVVRTIIIDKTQKLKVKLEPICYEVCKAFDMDVEVDLNRSVLEGDEKMVKKTLQKYSDRNDRNSLNRLDDSGCTPLSNAIKLRNSEITRLLLCAHDIDVNKKDEMSGYSPLHNACHISSAPIVNLLLQNQNIDVNIETKTGLTPLMRSCEMGDEEIVRMLIKVGFADLERCDDRGWNCLFFAAYAGNIQVVQLILNEGVTRESVDNLRYRAVDWAKYQNHGHVVSLLESFNGIISSSA